MTAVAKPIGALGVSFGVPACSLGWGVIAPIAFSVITFFTGTQGKAGLFQKVRLRSLSVQREGSTFVMKHVMAKLA